MPKVSKTTVRRRTAGLLKGVRTRFRDRKSVTFGGKTYAPAAIEAMLQDHLDALDAAEVARTIWTDKLNLARAKTLAIAPVLLGLERIVYSIYGDTAATELQDFDRPVRTRRKPDVSVQLRAVEQRRKTRVLRGTMGKRQRAKIKG